ncbi:hypothetical protein SprV_0501832300 [Sparganum proliferum]
MKMRVLERHKPVDVLGLPSSHHLTQRLEELPAADENATVETRGCRIRDVIHSTALTVLRRVRRPHQDWSDGNDAAISNLLGERNNLHRAYFDRPTDADKVAFYQYRRLAQQRWQKIQDSWIAHSAREIQGYADRNELKNFFTAIKAVCGLPTKGSAPLLSSDGSTLLTEKSQIRKLPQRSLYRPPSTDSPKRNSTSTWTSCPHSQEPSAPCDNSPPEMHPAPARSQLKSTSPAATD